MHSSWPRDQPDAVPALLGRRGHIAFGALLSAFTVNAFILLSSRTLIGLAIGADSAGRMPTSRSSRRGSGGAS